MAKAVEELDMENRDPNNLNSAVKSRFEDVFGEPDGIRSIDCVWRTTFSCFTCSVACCYNIMTILCGVPLALFWGLQFAMLACCHIWVVTPGVREYMLCIHIYQKLFESCLAAFVGPCCTTCGLCFSKIQVKNVHD